MGFHLMQLLADTWYAAIEKSPSILSGAYTGYGSTPAAAICEAWLVYKRDRIEE